MRRDEVKVFCPAERGQVSQVSGNAGSSTPTAKSKCEKGELDQVNKYMITVDDIKSDKRKNIKEALIKFRRDRS